MSTLLDEYVSLISRYKNLPTDKLGEICDTIESLTKEHMPSGSGFDDGTTFNFDESNENKLVFNTSFHHMNFHGFYVGWTEHKVVVVPDFRFKYMMNITGRNKNDIKDYIGEVFSAALDTVIEPSASPETALSITLEALRKIRNMCPATCDMTVAHSMANEADTAIETINKLPTR